MNGRADRGARRAVVAVVHDQEEQLIRTPERLALVAVGLLSATVTAVHHATNPVVINLDTPSFLQAASRLVHQGNPFDEERTVGYPLLLAASGLSTTAVTVLQAILFVATCVAVAYLALRATGHWWAALGAGTILPLIEPIIGWSRVVGTECLAMALFAAVACLMVMRRPALAVAAAGMLAFTRLEFLLLPALLLAVLFVTRSGRRRACAAIVVGTYVGLVGYAAGNWAVNDYPGLSVVSRINLLGKVMQYEMHDTESRVGRAIVRYNQDGFEGKGPYLLADRLPELREGNWSLAGDYARARILAAPHVFVWNVLRTFLEWFLVVAAYWLVRWRSNPTLGLLALLCVYDGAMVALGGYDSYDRLLAASYPLRVALLASTLVLGVQWLATALAGLLPRGRSPRRADEAN